MTKEALYKLVTAGVIKQKQFENRLRSGRSDAANFLIDGYNLRGELDVGELEAIGEASKNNRKLSDWANAINQYIEKRYR